MNKSHTLKIHSDLKEIKKVSAEILDFLKACKLFENELLDIKLCLEEALINAIKHGNRLDKSLKVKIDYKLGDDAFKVTITDEGEGFDYRHVPDPTLEENLQELKGRGIFLIRRLMDEVEFNEKGNSITMVKFLNKGVKSEYKHRE